MSKDCRFKETNVLEVDKEEPLSENGCFDMESIELNALETGSVHVSEGNRKLRTGIDSCAEVTVFPETVAEDYSMRQTPGNAKSYTSASGEPLPDLGARKVQVKLKDGSLRCVNPRVADTHKALIAVSEMNDMHGSRRVLSQKRQNNQSVRVFELLVELVPYERSTSKSSNTKAYSSPSAIEQIGSLMRKITSTGHLK